ncbi:MAG: succinylglutamate desuccinylase/aspartoacylase family protein [Gammaproteobacteria bacterium]|nr:succinylglutamate desuccinylase/aspartoacylase family protein [Gammaproteobacteria bacterium]MDH5304852.1 succinylglutamate desuccinylase/aspartoacylase family protein [Gammaproteobacteria bacterium]
MKNASTGVQLALTLWFVGTGIVPAAGHAAEDWSTPFQLLGRETAPGTKNKFPFIDDRSFEASYLNMPVFVARGAAPGPTLCLAAGIHGDELNGVEVARRAFAEIDPKDLRGTVIALPAINAEGVRTGNRYLSDRRDLNRSFPGSAGGSVASIIAYAVFTKIIKNCNALIDLHTASNNRANVPQIRADLSIPAIHDLALHFGLGIVVNGGGPDGSLRGEAAQAGIAAIIYEAGEPLRFEEDEIDRGMRGVHNVMAYLDMTDNAVQKTADDRVYQRSKWVRAARGHGGFFFPMAKLGDLIKEGDTLGKVVDPLTDEAFNVVSPLDGEVIGVAVPQPVLSGYGLFHLAWHESD